VLRPGVAPGRWDLTLHDPAPDLAPWVEYHWIVRWDLRGRPSHRQEVLSHPNVHLVFEKPHAAVHGVVRDVFARELVDAGHVFGVRFRAGAARPFLPVPISELTDRARPATGLFGPDIARTNAAILAADDEHDRVDLAEARLRAILETHPGAADPLVAEVTAIVDHIVATPTLLRVDDVAAATGVTVRRLQRLFAEYVGVGPKWVLRRARLHEIVARAATGAPIDWAGLAADLGYADQAHLVRDFTATVGTTPARYTRT